MSILDTVQFMQSPYCTTGRSGYALTDIVLHWMDSTLAGADAEFAHGSRRVSATFGVENAVIHGYVRETDTAWHAGNWPENCRSIGIEHSATPTRPASALTIATSVELIVALCRKIPTLNPTHIYPHKNFYPTQCCGTIPVAQMTAAVHTQLGLAVPTHPTPAPSPVKPAPAPAPAMYDITSCRNLQSAVKAVADGKWGNDTDNHAMSVRAAATGQSFNVRLVQGIVNTKIDGIFGPKSRAALKSKVMVIQKILKVSADGAWGPITDAAFNRIRGQFHNRY